MSRSSIYYDDFFDTIVEKRSDLFDFELWVYSNQILYGKENHLIFIGYL